MLDELIMDEFSCMEDLIPNEISSAFNLDTEDDSSSD